MKLDSNSSIGNDSSYTFLRRYPTEKGVKKVVCIDNNCFLALNIRSQLFLEDIRCRTTKIKYSFGVQRGFPSDMLYIPNSELISLFRKVCISTISGNLILFDIRNSLISGFYKAIQNNKQIPISSISHFLPNTSYQNVLNAGNSFPILVNLVSQENLFSVFDLREGDNFINPFLSFVAVQNVNETISTPYLQSEKIELLSNYTIDLQTKTMSRDFMKSKFYESIINDFSDPQLKQERKLNEKWLDSSLDTYSHIVENFENSINSFSKVLTLPQSFQDYSGNSFICAGNNLKLETIHFSHSHPPNTKISPFRKQINSKILSESSNKPLNEHYLEFTGKSFVIKEIISEHDRKPLSKCHHYDTINDMLMLDNEMLITCSNDKTLKIWK